MKIELVGGPDCGCVVNVKYIDQELDIRGAKYVRRDRPFNLSERYGAVYGQRGFRMYDYAAYIRSGKRGRIVRYELRDMEIYEKWIRGTPQATLAEEYNLSVSRISLICTDVRRSMPQQSREDLIALSVDQLEFLREKVIELVQMNGAPVTAGQMGDVVLDPETGEVVRDYSLRLRAIQSALAMNQTLARRLGLDAPAQTESVVKATVQYEIVGVDPGELT